MKFMESFLANRPKISASENPADEALAGDPSYGDLLDGDDGFGGGLSRGGGFQSLRTALMEAGNVVVPGAEPVRPQRSAEAEASTEHHGEPTVEVVSNNGRVEKIIVTCSCCKRIEIQCSY